MEGCIFDKESKAFEKANESNASKKFIIKDMIIISSDNGSMLKGKECDQVGLKLVTE